MNTDWTEFGAFLAAVRRWDGDAVEELVGRYQPLLCQLIRRRLAGNDLRRMVDSTDLCQSVMRRFLEGAAAGEFDLEKPKALEQLLVTMILNRFRDLARKRRPSGQVPEVAAEGSSPSQHLVHLEQAELLERVVRGLSPEARQIQRWREEKRSWEEIGRELGKPPHGVRIRFARELKKAAQVARRLGLDPG